MTYYILCIYRHPRGTRRFAASLPRDRRFNEPKTVIINHIFCSKCSCLWAPRIPYNYQKYYRMMSNVKGMCQIRWSFYRAMASDNEVLTSYNYSLPTAVFSRRL